MGPLIVEGLLGLLQVGGWRRPETHEGVRDCRVVTDHYREGTPPVVLRHRPTVSGCPRSDMYIQVKSDMGVCVLATSVGPSRLSQTRFLTRTLLPLHHSHRVPPRTGTSTSQDSNLGARERMTHCNRINGLERLLGRYKHFTSSVIRTSSRRHYSRGPSTCHWSGSLPPVGVDSDPTP